MDFWVKQSNGSDHIKEGNERLGWGDGNKGKREKKNLDHFSICACHPCAGAMLIFSVSFQFYRMSPKRQTLIIWSCYIKPEFSFCAVDVGRVAWERRRFALVWTSSPRRRHHNSFGLNLEMACLSLVRPLFFLCSFCEVVVEEWSCMETRERRLLVLARDFNITFLFFFPKNGPNSSLFHPTARFHF